MIDTVSKDQFNSLFLYRWHEGFANELIDILERYKNIVQSLRINDSFYSEIDTICTLINKTVSLYLSGLHYEANRLFNEILCGDFSFLSCIGDVCIQSCELLYSARKQTEYNNISSIKDIFHVPITKRGKISTERFSYPGHPCLYLSDSIQTCWEELSKPSLTDFYVSQYRVTTPFKLLDLRIPNEKDYKPETIYKTLRRIPLIIACNFVVKNSNDVFKPEYILPQLLLESIVARSRKQLNRQSHILDKNLIWGVIYTSTKKSQDQCSNGEQSPYNIALPVVKCDTKLDYCDYLASLFEISTPICCEDAVSSNSNNFDTLTNSEISKIESRLFKQGYEKLDYLLLGAHDNTITLDCTGSPVSVDVHCSGKYTIK